MIHDMLTRTEHGLLPTIHIYECWEPYISNSFHFIKTLPTRTHSMTYCGVMIDDDDEFVDGYVVLNDVVTYVSMWSINNSLDVMGWVELSHGDKVVTFQHSSSSAVHDDQKVTDMLRAFALIVLNENGSVCEHVAN